jgi:hypothetical protein
MAGVLHLVDGGKSFFGANECAVAVHKFTVRTKRAQLYVPFWRGYIASLCVAKVRVGLARRLRYVE